VNIQIVDRLHGKGNARASQLDKIPKLDENDVKRRLYETLERVRSQGIGGERAHQRCHIQEELRELSPAEHRELRRFEAENKGFAERLAAGLNRAVMREDMDGTRGV